MQQDSLVEDSLVGGKLEEDMQVCSHLEEDKLLGVDKLLEVDSLLEVGKLLVVGKLLEVDKRQADRSLEDRSLEGDKSQGLDDNH